MRVQNGVAVKRVSRVTRDRNEARARAAANGLPRSRDRNAAVASRKSLVRKETLAPQEKLVRRERRASHGNRVAVVRDGTKNRSAKRARRKSRASRAAAEHVKSGRLPDAIASEPPSRAALNVIATLLPREAAKARGVATQHRRIGDRSEANVVDVDAIARRRGAAASELLPSIAKNYAARRITATRSQTVPRTQCRRGKCSPANRHRAKIRCCSKQRRSASSTSKKRDIRAPGSATNAPRTGSRHRRVRTTQRGSRRGPRRNVLHRPVAVAKAAPVAGAVAVRGSDRRPSFRRVEILAHG